MHSARWARWRLTKEWADYTLVLDGGIQGCYVELDMVGGDSNAYFDNMTISQPMKAGDEAMLVYDFVETGDVSSHDSRQATRWQATCIGIRWPR